MAIALLLASAPSPAGAVELKVSRDALERTLKQQLFSGADGRYYLKGNAQSACYVYAEDPKLKFVEDRIVVQLKRRTPSWGDYKVAGACIGIGAVVAGRGFSGPGRRGRDL